MPLASPMCWATLQGSRFCRAFSGSATAFPDPFSYPHEAQHSLGFIPLALSSKCPILQTDPKGASLFPWVQHLPKMSLVFLPCVICTSIRISHSWSFTNTWPQHPQRSAAVLVELQPHFPDSRIWRRMEWIALNLGCACTHMYMSFPHTGRPSRQEEKGIPAQLQMQSHTSSSCQTPKTPKIQIWSPNQLI